MVVSSRRWVRFLGFLWISFSCDSASPGANVSIVPAPPIQMDVLLASMAQASGEQEALVLDHVMRVEHEPRATVLLLASSKDHCFATIFERDGDEETVGMAEHNGYRVVMQVALPRLDPLWMRPQAPTMADIDGDGRADILLRFQIIMADRVIQTGMICRHSQDGWEAFAAPSPLGEVRQALRGSPPVFIHQEDKVQTLVVAGKKLRLQGLSHGGGWRLVPGPGGEEAGLLTIGALSGSDTAAHGLAFVLYRLGDRRFVVASDWNDGQVLFRPAPVRGADLDVEKIVAAGFSKSALAQK